jgi:hypothetical protein
MFLSGISRRLVTICLVFFCVLSIFLLGVSASFATMPSRPTIPGTQAKVDGLFFYECGRDMPPQQDRVYKRMFSKSRTRNIAWELRLLHPKTPKKVDFRITAKYLKPGGGLLVEQYIDASIDAGRSKSHHSSSQGRDQPGFWLPGKYVVILYVEGLSIHSGFFMVTTP